jgi:manganese/iron transport system permease protein
VIVQALLFVIALLYSHFKPVQRHEITVVKNH